MATESEVLEVRADVDVKELESVNASLDNMSNALADVDAQAGQTASGASGLSSAFEKARSLADGFNEVMGAMGTAMGMVGSAFDATIQPFIDLQEQQNLFSAQTGITGEALADFGDIANEVFRSGRGESLAEVYEAMGQVRNITQATGDELQNITSISLNFGKVFDRDITESARAANVMMKNFGISGEQAFDVLTVGMQQTGDPSQDLLDTFQEYSTVFADMGFSAEQSMGLIAQFMEAGGRNTDVAADALKEFNIRLSDGTAVEGLQFLSRASREAFNGFGEGSITASEALQVIIADINAIEDPTARAAAGVAFFGTKWEDASSAIAAFDPANAVNGLGQIQGASDATANTLDSGITPAFERMKRALSGAVMDIAEDDVTSGLEGLTAFLDFVVAASDLEVQPTIKVTPDWGMLTEEDQAALGVGIEQQLQAEPVEIDKMAVVVSTFGLALAEAGGVEISESDQLKVYEEVSGAFDFLKSMPIEINLVDILTFPVTGIASLIDTGAVVNAVEDAFNMGDESGFGSQYAPSTSFDSNAMAAARMSNFGYTGETVDWMNPEITASLAIEPAGDATTMTMWNAFGGQAVNIFTSMKIDDAWMPPFQAQLDAATASRTVDVFVNLNWSREEVGDAVQSTVTRAFGGSRDSGGMGNAGEAYLIGTGAQPELFIPSSQGSFYPAGQYGGGNLNANITLNLDGQVIYQTMQNIAMGGG